MKALMEPWSLVLIVIVVLILFGPKRLPDLGKSFRRSMKAFKEEVEEKPGEAADSATGSDREAAREGADKDAG